MICTTSLYRNVKKAGFELDVVYTTANSFDIVSRVNANKGISYSLVDTIYHFDAPNIVCVPFAEPQMQWQSFHIIRKDAPSDSLARRCFHDISIPQI